MKNTMRQLLIILALIMTMTPVYGESYFQDGTIWKTVRGYSSEPNQKDEYQQVYLESETSSEDGRIFKVYSGDPTGKHEYICKLKDSGSRVYFKEEASDEWYLMYDFGLGVGDTSCVYTPKWAFGTESGPISTYVKCVGEEVYAQDSTPCTSLVLEEYGDENYEICYGKGYWLKGLGSVNGLVENCRFENLDGMGSRLYEVICENKVVFSLSTMSAKPTFEKKDISIECNGKTFFINCKSTISKVTVYSTDGRILHTYCPATENFSGSVEQPGVYIIAVDDTISKIYIK